MGLFPNPENLHGTKTTSVGVGFFAEIVSRGSPDGSRVKLLQSSRLCIGVVLGFESFSACVLVLCFHGMSRSGFDCSLDCRSCKHILTFLCLCCCRIANLRSPKQACPTGVCFLSENPAPSTAFSPTTSAGLAKNKLLSAEFVFRSSNKLTRP